MSKKLFEVTVKESWHATYTVEAEDKKEALGIIDDAINRDEIRPDDDDDDPDSYSRETEICEVDYAEPGAYVFRRTD